MSLSGPREKLARRKARELLAELGIQSLPVDPFEIARKKRPEVLVVEQELPEEIYGACSYRNGRFVIAVSTRCPTTGHRRFTAGHELGHYHMPGHVQVMFGGAQEWVVSKGGHFQPNADPVEREADFFASELLMPEPLLKPLIRGRPGLALVKSVAGKCEVSLTAAAITVARLSGDPIAVLVSRDGVLEWPAFTPALNAYPWARVRVKGQWTPPRSCSARMAKSPGRVKGAEQMQGEGLLCEWFEGAPDSIKVTEEVVGLGEYGRVLTILRPDYLPDPDQEQERDWRQTRDRWTE
ncbi:MAG: ImmA/IrrE family metallo-endopeptidase [Gemmatimonadales bacterium]